MGLIYCFLTVTLRANQNVTGLALTTFGIGIGNFFGGSLISITKSDVPSISLNATSKLFRASLPLGENVNVFVLDLKTGKKREIFNGAAFVSAGTTLNVCSFDKWDDSIIIAETDSDRAFYKDGDLKMEKCDISYVLDEKNKSITFKADKYVHAVEVEGNLILDENYFSLLPNEERTVSFVKHDEEKALDLTVQAYTLK